MNSRAYAKAKLLRDVPLHNRRRCCRKRDDRSGPQRRQMLPDVPVIRPEIVAPCRYAMRLIDRDQARLSFGEHLREAPHAQPLRRNEQKVELPVQVLQANFARCRPVAARMDSLGREPERLQSSQPDLPSTRSVD